MIDKLQGRSLEAQCVKSSLAVLRKLLILLEASLAGKSMQIVNRSRAPRTVQQGKAYSGPQSLVLADN